MFHRKIKAKKYSSLDNLQFTKPAQVSDNKQCTAKHNLHPLTKAKANFYQVILDAVIVLWQNGLEEKKIICRLNVSYSMTVWELREIFHSSTLKQPEGLSRLGEICTDGDVCRDPEQYSCRHKNNLQRKVCYQGIGKIWHGRWGYCMYCKLL